MRDATAGSSAVRATPRCAPCSGSTVTAAAAAARRSRRARVLAACSGAVGPVRCDVIRSALRGTPRGYIATLTPPGNSGTHRAAAARRVREINAMLRPLCCVVCDCTEPSVGSAPASIVRCSTAAP